MCVCVYACTCPKGTRARKHVQNNWIAQSCSCALRWWGLVNGKCLEICDLMILCLEIIKKTRGYNGQIMGIHGDITC